MAGKIEKSKGKVEVAVGSLTGNKKLESQGRIDRQAGDAKSKVNHAKTKVADTAEKAERNAVRVIDRARDAARHK